MLDVAMQRSDVHLLSYRNLDIALGELRFFMADISGTHIVVVFMGQMEIL